MIFSHFIKTWKYSQTLEDVPGMIAAVFAGTAISGVLRKSPLLDASTAFPSRKDAIIAPET
jgi:hypothetical protein